jgi:Ca-activated chloride channel family protein
VIIPPSRILEPAKASALLRKIDPSGGTEIFQGLQAGFDQIQSNYSPAHVNHIVLLTDGHTYGDDRDCVAIAEKAALRNIGITCMGLGSDWNDILLDTIATATGNSSAYIAQPTDIQKMLVRKFESLANVYSEDVQIDIRENNSVALNYAFRISPDASPLKDGVSIHLGPILHNQHLSILFEFKVEPSEAKVDNAILLDGILKLNMAARPTPLAPIRLLLTRDYVTEPVPQPPPDVLLNALSRVRLYRMQERARADLDEGRFDAATSLLQTLATHLLSQGERSLANTVLLEVDNLRKSQNMSSEGGKDIKYKTRALLLSAPQERK